MQFCQYCEDAASCELKKRTENDPLAPCQSFRLSEGTDQVEYEGIKDLVRSVRDAVNVQANQQPVLDMNIPLEIRADRYPHPDACVMLLNLDLSDQSSYQEFVSKYLDPFSLEFAEIFEPLKDQLRKAQQTITGFLNGQGLNVRAASFA